VFDSVAEPEVAFAGAAPAAELPADLGPAIADDDAATDEPGASLTARTPLDGALTAAALGPAPVPTAA
jgi:hypothetical protein